MPTGTTVGKLRAILSYPNLKQMFFQVFRYVSISIFAIINSDENLNTEDEKGSQLGVSDPEGNKQNIINKF